MRERGIIFSGAMVREVLTGRKTVTRRVIRQMLCEGHGGPGRAALRAFDPSTGVATFGDAIPDDPVPIEVKCPYGVPGDRLWCREAFSLTQVAENADTISYRADGAVYERGGANLTERCGKASFTVRDNLKHVTIQEVKKPDTGAEEEWEMIVSSLK